MFDLLVKGGTLPDGKIADIGIKGAVIAAIGDLGDVEAGEVIDATGDLVSPPFVDPHFHMDATLSYGLPRINASGTLLEGIGLWGELKQVMTREDVVARALDYCDWAASMGLLAIRSHVDTCDDRLLGVEALLEVREHVKDYIDLQLVAFPQDGFYRDLQRGPIPSARLIWVWMWWAVSRILNARWPMARPRSPSCARLRPSVACRWTCIVTRRTILTRAISRCWPMRQRVWGCRGVWRDHTSPRCIRWTIIMSPSCCR